MKYIIPIVAAALAVVATPAQAATLFSTTLSGANETTPNASTATGTGTLLLATGNNSINVVLSWAALIGGTATGAHIHCCAAQGANGPVAIDFGPPAVVTGSLTRTYDLTLASTYTTGFVNANGGTAASAQAAFLAGLLSGRTYYNVHNATFPGGEIRGQLAAVPETATWGMMIVGFGLVGGALRTRRRALVAA